MKKLLLSICISDGHFAWLLAIVFSMVGLLASCISQPDSGVSAVTPVPTPRNKRIGAFLWQQDGLYAYRMLRPTRWQAVDNRDRRSYFPQPQVDEIRLLLSAVNYRIYSGKSAADDVDVRWTLYQTYPSLDKWSQAVNEHYGKMIWCS